MNIHAILALEERLPVAINLILSGSFVNVYNQSFYLLTEVLGRTLKANARHIKSAGNQFVVSGGFPLHQVQEHYPDAIKTSWGYQIRGDYDTRGYAKWLLLQKPSAQAGDFCATAVADSRAHLCACEAATQNLSDNEQKTTKLTALLLTEQQIDYLQNWQKNRYPLEVDFGFIKSLKQQLTDQ